MRFLLRKLRILLSKKERMRTPVRFWGVNSPQIFGGTKNIRHWGDDFDPTISVVVELTDGAVGLACSAAAFGHGLPLLLSLLTTKARFHSSKPKIPVTSKCTTVLLLFTCLDGGFPRSISSTMQYFTA